jgi:IS30 family transposase
MIGELISPLILKGQSLNHIYSSHAAELRFSERTLYNYIDHGAFKIRNLDLPKKVKYSLRKPKKVLTKLEYAYRRGRSYSDFESYMLQNPNANVVEMDTVKGARGSGKALLTMIFRSSNFMLIFLLPDGTINSVLAVFDMLTRILGLETFRRLFPVILTDNGVEFKAPHEMEHATNGCQRTRLFYCDPQASWQKPHIEKNHVFIRQILPKGTSFGRLTNDDVTLVARHINSVAREMFENKTPFEMLDKQIYEKLLDSLQLVPVPSDEVILKPALLSR